jgi:hypothetical protein
MELPDLVFNGAEAFSGEEPLEVTRNKAISKKILAYFGVPVPGLVSYRLREQVESQPALTFPLIVKPLQADASAGISQASYFSIIGNDDALEVLPITEMVFDKRRTRPEERIATQFAKWDESYRVLEANPNPFMSYGHDMANAAAKAGMEYYDFIQRIVDAAVARYEPA